MPREAKLTERGFQYITFIDANRQECSIQQSSAIDFDRVEGPVPGASFLWLGVDDANPQILASQAKSVGIETEETCGWIPYPVPEEVSLTTRMHITPDIAEKLIDVLQTWLRTGFLEETDDAN